MPLGPDHARASRTDADRWDGLVHRYVGLVWSVPRGHGFDPATSSQIAQTCWLRLVEQVDDIDGTVGEWLLRAARQESARAARWHDGSGRSALPVEPPLQSLAELPARLRLALRVWATDAEPSTAELAAALDVAAESVPTALEQGLERLTVAVGDAPGGSAEIADRLRRAVADHDAPPAELLAAARAAFSWRTLDAELAPLISESSSHDDVLAGVRGVQTLRRLSFRADGLVLALEVSVDGLRRCVLGQLTPPVEAEVTLRLSDGTSLDVDVDDLGRFACDDVAHGHVSLRIVEAATGRLRHTDWVLL